MFKLRILSFIQKIQIFKFKPLITIRPNYFSNSLSNNKTTDKINNKNNLSLETYLKEVDKLLNKYL